jgi:hypothetical protein
VAYLTTAYLAFSGFWAFIKIRKFPIINALEEFKSPSGHQFCTYITAFYICFIARLNWRGPTRVT